MNEPNIQNNLIGGISGFQNGLTNLLDKLISILRVKL